MANISIPRSAGTAVTTQRGATTGAASSTTSSAYVTVISVSINPDAATNICIASGGLSRATLNIADTSFGFIRTLFGANAGDEIGSVGGGNAGVPRMPQDVIGTFKDQATGATTVALQAKSTDGVSSFSWNASYLSVVVINN